MALVDVGDVLPSFGFTVTSNSTGALAAPSTFTVALTAPDGTTPTVTVTNPSTGIYAVTYVATQAGRHTAVGTATGNGCDGVSTLVWDVADTTGPVVSLATLRRHLNVTTTSSDEDLRRISLVATDLAERFTGRTWRRSTVTETHDGGRSALLLRHSPISSVSSVVESGAALATGWVLDAAAGVLHRGTTSGRYPWLDGIQNVTVTYVVGPTVVPDTVQHAVLELSRHLWDTQRGGSNLPRQVGAGDDWDPRAGFSMPRRVVELLEPHRASGIA